MKIVLNHDELADIVSAHLQATFPTFDIHIDDELPEVAVEVTAQNASKPAKRTRKTKAAKPVASSDDNEGTEPASVKPDVGTEPNIAFLTEDDTPPFDVEAAEPTVSTAAIDDVPTKSLFA